MDQYDIGRCNHVVTRDSLTCEDLSAVAVLAHAQGQVRQPTRQLHGKRNFEVYNLYKSGSLSK